MCSTKIFLATIFNEIKFHVNIFLGLVGRMHPLHPPCVRSWVHCGAKKKSRGANINVSPAWWLSVVMKISLLWLTLSDPTYACEYRQNRRQWVFNRGLYVCAGLLEILKIDKSSTDLQCFSFQFRGLGALFGGLNLPTPSWRRYWISLNMT